MQFAGRGIRALFFGCLAAVATYATANPFVDTFGATATRQTSTFVPQFPAAGGTGYYSFANPAGTGNERSIGDGYYAVINPSQIIATGGGGYWENTDTGPIANFRDHTDGNGAVLVVNAGNVQNDIYRRIATLDGGKKYTARVWRFIVNGPTEISFKIREPDDSAQLSASPIYVTTGTQGVGGWTELSWTFSTSACAAAQYSVSLVNNSPVTSGNDLFFDDISVQEDPGATSQANIPCPSVASASVSAGSDKAQTNPGQAVTINVLGNDTSSDPVQAPLAPPTQGSRQASNGSVVFNVDGTVTYSPNTGFKGIDTFTYQICTTATAVNPSPACTEATVTVQVGAVAMATSPIPANAPWAIALTMLGILGFGAFQMRSRSS